jgi:hypothetical protein
MPVLWCMCCSRWRCHSWHAVQSFHSWASRWLRTDHDRKINIIELVLNLSSLRVSCFYAVIDQPWMRDQANGFHIVARSYIYDLTIFILCLHDQDEIELTNFFAEVISIKLNSVKLQELSVKFWCWWRNLGCILCLFLAYGLEPVKNLSVCP